MLNVQELQCIPPRSGSIVVPAEIDASDHVPTHIFQEASHNEGVSGQEVSGTVTGVALPPWMTSHMVTQGMSVTPREKARGKMKTRNTWTALRGTITLGAIDDVSREAMQQEEEQAVVVSPIVDDATTQDDQQPPTAACGGGVGVGPRVGGRLHYSPTVAGYHDHFDDIGTAQSDAHHDVGGGSRLHHGATQEGWHDHLQCSLEPKIKDVPKVKLHGSPTQEGWHDDFDMVVAPKVEAMAKGKLGGSADQEGWVDHMLLPGVSDRPAFIDPEKRHGGNGSTLVDDHFESLGVPKWEDVPGHRRMGTPLQEGWVDSWRSEKELRPSKRFYSDAMVKGRRDHFETFGTVNSIPVMRGRRVAPETAMAYDDHFIYSGEVAGDGSKLIRRRPSTPLIDPRWKTDRMDTSWTRSRRRGKRHVPILS